jgi:hypothetical protein
MIAIREDFLDDQSMAGSLALHPQLVSGAAIERNEARFDGFSPRLFIHEADHEDASGFIVLNHRGHQAVEFAEIQIHRRQIKKPTVSGGLFLKS